LHIAAFGLRETASKNSAMLQSDHLSPEFYDSMQH
jgi:hypothetical protein